MFRFWRLNGIEKALIVCQALALCSVFAGCGEKLPAKAAPPLQDAAPGAVVTPEPAPAPAPAPESPAAQSAAQNDPSAAAASSAALDEAVAAGDFVALEALLQAQPAPAKELRERWEKLSSVLVSKPLIEGLDLLGVDTRLTAPREYTLSFLLHCTAALKEDYQLTVTAAVAPEHVQFIRPSKPGALYTTKRIRLAEHPTSSWKPGEYHVARLKMASERIPYNLTLGLQTRDAQDKWLANPGTAVALGWQFERSQLADFVRLAALEAEYKRAGKPSETADKLFAGRWAETTAVMFPRTLVEGLDLLAVDTRVSGEKEYTFSFLLKSTADLDTDYHLSVTAEVSPEHAKFIEPSKPGVNYIKRPVILYSDPTSQWKAGEYHVARLTLASEIIPYELGVILQTRDAQKRVSGNPGNFVKLGWQPDSSKIPAAVALHALQHVWRESGRYNETLAQAFERRWQKLAAGRTPQALNDELELLGVETRATGDREYTFSFLLHAQKEVSRDYHLSVIGRVDRGNLQHITPSKPEGNYISRSVLLYADPTSKWKAGEYHAAQLRLETELIPYDLSAILQTRDGDKRVNGNPGNVVELGWQADVTE